MQLVEQHLILKNDKRFQVIDNATFASKNLYDVCVGLIQMIVRLKSSVDEHKAHKDNFANYAIRQEFIFSGRYITYPELARLVKEKEPYRALPAKVAQQVLINLDKNWQSFFAAIKEWKERPEKFNGKPSLPRCFVPCARQYSNCKSG